MLRRLVLLSALALGLLLARPVGRSDIAWAAFVPFPGPQCTSYLAINQTASTDIKTFTNTGYICHIFITSATAQNLNLVQGTGTTCATSTVGLLGGTTAATGPNLGANTGWIEGSGIYPILKTTTTGQHLCLLQSSTGQVSGTINYIDQ